MTALKSFASLFTSYLHCCHSLFYACSYSCVTHCSRLPLLSREAYLSQATNVIQNESQLQKKKKGGEKRRSWRFLGFVSPLFFHFTTFLPLPTLIRHDGIANVAGKQVWLQPLQPVCSVGLQRDHVLPPHTQIVCKDNTHPSCIKLSNWIPAFVQKN